MFFHVDNLKKCFYFANDVSAIKVKKKITGNLIVINCNPIFKHSGKSSAILLQTPLQDTIKEKTFVKALKADNF